MITPIKNVRLYVYGRCSLRKVRLQGSYMWIVVNLQYAFKKRVFTIYMYVKYSKTEERTTFLNV